MYIVYMCICNTPHVKKALLFYYHGQKSIFTKISPVIYQSRMTQKCEDFQEWKILQ